MTSRHRPRLSFSPTAWAKLLFLRDYGETEVGGFGISAVDDLLLVEDVQLIPQVSSWAHVAFDDGAVADFFDSQVDAGRRPEEFARIWIHTHPGDCPRPSQMDEQTFARVFGRADWCLMFILARGGESYARLRFNTGPGANLQLPIEIDYGHRFAGCEIEAWGQEYLACVQPQVTVRTASRTVNLDRHELFGQEFTSPEFDPWLHDFDPIFDHRGDFNDRQ